jgi:hypothetical protein
MRAIKGGIGNGTSTDLVWQTQAMAFGARGVSLRARSLYVGADESPVRAHGREDVERDGGTLSR